MPVEEVEAASFTPAWERYIDELQHPHFHDAPTGPNEQTAWNEETVFLTLTAFLKNATAFEAKHDRVLKKHGQGFPKFPKTTTHNL